VLHMGSYWGPVYDGVPEIGEHTEPGLTGLLGLSADELHALGAAAVISAARVPA
jgi:hypothetical protein